MVATAWGSDVYLTDEADVEADATLVNSEHMRRTLIDRGAAPERLHLVDLGVDLERFRPARDAPGSPVILSPRAATPLYNLDVVVAGFELLRERVGDATLVLAHGDLPLPDDLRLPAGASAIRDVPHEEMPGSCGPRPPWCRSRAPTARPTPSGRRSPAACRWSPPTCLSCANAWATTSCASSRRLPMLWRRRCTTS